MLRDIRGPAMLAAELLAVEGDELIEKVQKNYPVKSTLILLATAADQAERIAQVIKAVEASLAVAAAAVA